MIYSKSTNRVVLKIYTALYSQWYKNNNITIEIREAGEIGSVTDMVAVIIGIAVMTTGRARLSRLRVHI